MGGDNVAVLPPGLPNIIGNAAVGYWGAAPSGAFYGSGSVRTANLDSSSLQLRFDASRSNIIYGNSDTVQPPTVTLIPQIKF